MRAGPCGHGRGAQIRDRDAAMSPPGCPQALWHCSGGNGASQRCSHPRAPTSGRRACGRGRSRRSPLLNGVGALGRNVAAHRGPRIGTTRGHNQPVPTPCGERNSGLGPPAAKCRQRRRGLFRAPVGPCEGGKVVGSQEGSVQVGRDQCGSGKGPVPN